MTKVKWILFVCLIAIIGSCKFADQSSTVTVWITSGDQSRLFEKEIKSLDFNADLNTEKPLITVDTMQTFQKMEGFGYSMTGGSAILINQMESAEREKLLDELFLKDDTGIGISYLRISIGASDLDPYVFSYNDLPEGETDPGMEHFSLDADRENLIPILKKVLERNPDIKIMGSPWSPPVWMKTNRSSVGGRLMPEYYDAYATYFVKYIQGMEKEGIPIDAISIQNEPLHPENNPSLLMKADEQADFLKIHLGPAFEKNDIETKILIYDHNLDRIDYPLEILDDPEARKYVSGTAFHLYGGVIDSMSVIHNNHPDKKLYFTEQWTGSEGDFRDDLFWHIENLIIGAPRNWSRNVLEWNLASDPDQKPHTEGGCTQCLGAVTIDGNKVTRNVSWYIIAHASKFVRPGSVRIYSSKNEKLPNVAFKTPKGKTVLIVLNSENADQSFYIRIGEHTAKASLSAGSAGTFVWN